MCLLGSGELVSEIVVLGAVVAALGLSLLVYRSYRVAAREQARYAAEQRHARFEQSAGGRAAHKAQAKMRQQSAADDRAAEQRIADWNS